MKVVLLLALLTVALAQDYYPVVVRNGNSFVYVGFGNQFFSFRLPDLSLAFSGTYQKTFSYPGTLQGATAVFGDGSTGQIQINTADYSAAYSETAAPFSTGPQFFDYIENDVAGNTFEFVAGSASQSALVNKTNTAGSYVGSLTLPNSVSSQAGHNYARYYQLVGNQLYIVAATQQGRGGSDFDFYIVNTDTFAITLGPVRLPNSASSGCPVPPRGCEPPSTIYLDVVNGQLVYLYANGVFRNGVSQLQATLSAYTPSCGFASNSFGDNAQPSNTGTGNCATTSPSSNNQPSSMNQPSVGNSGPSSSSTSTPVDTGDCLPNGCAEGTFCCAGQCYSSSFYTCFAQENTYQLCPAGTLACGKSCYSPALNSCVAGNKLCPAGYSACGEACYDASQYSCNDGVLAYKQ